MERVKIARIASPICWWRNYIGQECSVLDVDEKTGFIKICFMAKEEGFEPFPQEGWIDPIYTDIVS